MELPAEEGRLGRLVRRAEESVFFIFVVLMIGLGLLPVVLRYTSSVGMPGTAVLSRHLLLWIALLGAGTAVRERSSISIDLVSHLLSVRKRLVLRGMTEIAAAVFCGAVVWISIAFVRSKAEFETGTLPLLSVPEWWASLVLPAGFSVLALRLMVAGAADLVAALRAENRRSGVEGG